MVVLVAVEAVLVEQVGQDTRHESPQPSNERI
jgi:hypothetical protein